MRWAHSVGGRCHHALTLHHIFLLSSQDEAHLDKVAYQCESKDAARENGLGDFLRETILVWHELVFAKSHYSETFRVFEHAIAIDWLEALLVYADIVELLVIFQEVDPQDTVVSV